MHKNLSSIYTLLICTLLLIANPMRHPLKRKYSESYLTPNHNVSFCLNVETQNQTMCCTLS